MQNILIQLLQTLKFQPAADKRFDFFPRRVLTAAGSVHFYAAVFGRLRNCGATPLSSDF